MDTAELESLLLEDLLQLHDQVVRVLREHACLQVLEKGDRVVHIGSDGHQIPKRLRGMGTVKRAFKKGHGTVQFDECGDKRCHESMWAFNVVKLPANADLSLFVGRDDDDALNDDAEDHPIPGQQYYVVR